MASTFTTNFAIEKPGTGEQSGTWGTTTNHNFDIFDRLAGYKSVTVSGTTHTLTRCAQALHLLDRATHQTVCIVLLSL